MQKILKGIAHLYAEDNIDTDQIIPAERLTTGDPTILGKYAFEKVHPDFVKKVKAGDFIVGGKNFGCGSSREHAPIAFKGAGIVAVIAPYFSRIFYRNSINGGAVLPIELDLIGKVEDRDELEIDMQNYEVRNITRGGVYKFKPFPDFILNMIEGGGIVEYTKRELAKRNVQP